MVNVRQIAVYVNATAKAEKAPAIRLARSGGSANFVPISSTLLNLAQTNGMNHVKSDDYKIYFHDKPGWAF